MPEIAEELADDEMEEEDERGNITIVKISKTIKDDDQRAAIQGDMKWDELRQRRLRRFGSILGKAVCTALVQTRASICDHTNS